MDYPLHRRDAANAEKKLVSEKNQNKKGAYARFKPRAQLNIEAERREGRGR